MKKTTQKKTLNNLFKGFFAILYCMIIISCNREGIEIQVNEMDPIKNKGTMEWIKETNNKGIPFPEGSKAFKLDNGNFRIELPENQKFVTQSLEEIESVTSELGGIEVNCTCIIGNSCSPLKKDGAYYCITSQNCSTCDFRLYSPKNRQSQIIIKDIIDYNLGVSFIKEDDNRKYKPMNSQIINLPSVKRGVLNFYSKLYNGNIPDYVVSNEDPPKHVKYGKVNIYGFYMMLPIPQNTNLKGVHAENLNLREISGISCRCETNQDGCTKTKGFGGVYCDAGKCQSCTLIDN